MISKCYNFLNNICILFVIDYISVYYIYSWIKRTVGNENYTCTTQSHYCGFQGKFK